MKKVKFILIGLITLIAAGYLGWDKISNNYYSLVNYVDLYFHPVNPSTESDKGWVKDNLKPSDFQIIPTADPKWNLYRNFKYGFQIQYPASLLSVKVFKFEAEDRIFVGFGSIGDFEITLYISNISSTEREYSIRGVDNLLTPEYKKVMLDTLEVF